MRPALLALCLSLVGCDATIPLSRFQSMKLDLTLPFLDGFDLAPGRPLSARVELPAGSYPDCELQADAKGTWNGVVMEKFAGQRQGTSGSCSIVHGSCNSGSEWCEPPTFELSSAANGPGDIILEDSTARIEARFPGLQVPRTATRLSPSGTIHPGDRVEFRLEPPADEHFELLMGFRRTYDEGSETIAFVNVQVGRIGGELRLTGSAPSVDAFPLQLVEGELVILSRVVVPVERCDGVASCTAESGLYLRFPGARLAP